MKSAGELSADNRKMVKTISKLESTKGMLVHADHLAARKPNAIGQLFGYVAGHGGDVWWVKHNDSSVGAYCFTEFNFCEGITDD